MPSLWCFILCIAPTAVALWSAEESGSVQGTVTVGGQPLTSGKIKLHSGGAKKPIELTIKEGKFGPEKVPAGGYAVTIEGAGVPASYSSDRTTPLTVEISSGANEIDVDLKGEKNREFEHFIRSGKY